MTPQSELEQRYRSNGDVWAGIELIDELRSAQSVPAAISLVHELIPQDMPPLYRAQLAIRAHSIGLYREAISLFESVRETVDGEVNRFLILTGLATAQCSAGLFEKGIDIFNQLQKPEWVNINDKLAFSEKSKTLWRSHPDRLLGEHSPVGKRIIVVHDIGGVGDLLQFVRYVDDLIRDGASKVYVLASKALRSIISTKSNAIFIEELPADEEWDYYCSIFGLFSRYQKSPYFPHHQTPYLFPDPDHTLPDRAVELLSRPRTRPRVALIWRSATKVQHEPFRSMPLGTLVPLLANRDIEWISLQVDKTSRDEDEILERFSVVHLGGDLKSFQDTAHILDAVDLLISIDSAPVHLAGAFGKSVWALLPQAADCRWYDDRRFTPWYPSVRLYRQVELGVWDSVLEDVKTDLEGLVARSRPIRP
jgi:hypothetical protein